MKLTTKCDPLRFINELSISVYTKHKFIYNDRELNNVFLQGRVKFPTGGVEMK